MRYNSNIMGELVDKGNKFLSPVQGHYTNLEITGGEGIYLHGVDGRKYIDFTSGIAVANTGHCHPKVIQAITKQAKNLLELRLRTPWGNTCITYSPG